MIVLFAGDKHVNDELNSNMWRLVCERERGWIKYKLEGKLKLHV